MALFACLISCTFSASEQCFFLKQRISEQYFQPNEQGYTCTSRSAPKKTCDSVCLECDGQSLGLECDGHAREALAQWLIDCGGLVADWTGQQGG
jgi:hypothetical protein